MPPKPATKRTSDRKDRARKFSDVERVEMKARAQELDMQGYNGPAIAERLGVSVPTAYTFLREIKEDYQAAYLDSRKALVMRETAVLLDVRRRAYEAMDEIKRTGRTKTVTKQTTVEGKSKKKAKNGGNVVEEVDVILPADEVTRTVESADIGGYLSIILETEAKLVQLWGLTELPKVVFNLGPTVQTNVFNQVLAAVLGGPQHAGIHFGAPAQNEAAHSPSHEQGTTPTTPAQQADGTMNPLANPFQGEGQ